MRTMGYRPPRCLTVLSGYENVPPHRGHEFRIVFEIGIPPLSKHVLLIVSICPNPQMLRVNAQRNVTFVADAHARRDLSEMHEPGSSVNWHRQQTLVICLVEGNSSITFDYSADPEPAITLRSVSRCFIHILPKTLCEWLACTFWRHVFLRRSSEIGVPRRTARNAAFGSYPSRGHADYTG